MQVNYILIIYTRGLLPSLFCATRFASSYEGRCMSFQQSTPLHLAAKEGSYNVVRYLVDKGADVNIKNQFGVSE